MSASPLLSRRSMVKAAPASLLLGLAAPALAEAPSRFARLEASSGARIGVAGLDTGTGAQIAHRATERFAFCSTFKVLAVSAVLKKSERDPHLLARWIGFSERGLLPYAPVARRHLGAGMTVLELCSAAIEWSDNTAADLILKLLGGPGAVTAYARSIGDRTFRLDRTEPSLNIVVPGQTSDTTSPAAMSADLRGLLLGDLRGDLLHPRQRDLLTGWMRACRTGLQRIRAAAPAGSVVADKTGTWTGRYNAAGDIAVIQPPRRAPIVLSVYTAGQRRGSQDALIAAAAKVAFAALA
ncbi:MAG: class A beta-lactamase [Caulobacteraceae bacterium]